MNVISFLLYPFSLLYGGIMWVRNKLYDQKFLKSTRFGVPVISIGNLTVGGTGKTPHVEYLLRLLYSKKTATLSRGYKRKTTGFILADASATAAAIGDEPYQYYLDFPQVKVAVAEDRALGINQLLANYPDLDAIILDDAYQHRGVSPSLNILLTDYARLFYQDYVLPAGRLREFPGGANRAEIVIVTKCPDSLTREEMQKIKKTTISYTPLTVPVFFTRYAYGNLVSCNHNQTVAKDIVVVTAIANVKPFIHYLQEQNYHIVHHYQFPDHHAYTETDVEKIFKDWQRYSQHKPVSIITTRKDAVKLTDLISAMVYKNMPLFYLPIKVAFVQDQEDFDKLILNHLAKQIKPENN